MCKKVVKEFMSLLSNQQIDALCCICKDIYFNSSDRNRDDQWGAVLFPFHLVFAKFAMEINY